MVSSSFNIIHTFLVLMMLPLLSVTHSASSKDASEVLASDGHGTSKLAAVPRVGTLNLNQQETYLVSVKRLLGRKMVFKRLLGMEKPEVAYLNGRQSFTSTTTPSGSALTVRHSIDTNVETQRLRNTRRGRPQTHRRMKEKIDGNFIPLNADYHVPRPHPPKNN